MDTEYVLMLAGGDVMVKAPGRADCEALSLQPSELMCDHFMQFTKIWPDEYRFPMFWTLSPYNNTGPGTFAPS